MKHVIALDIGGTKIEGALFDEKFREKGKHRIYFPKKGSSSTVNLPRKQVLAIICEMVDTLKKGGINGIGVSIPDVIDDKGTIVGTSKIKALDYFELGTFLKKKYRCRVTVNNDADCFAYGEAKLGAGKGYKNVIGIIFGTGIGSGIIINGELYIGSTGSCGEFGHNVLNPKGPNERNGFIGTVEAYAGGPDIIRNYLKHGGKNKKISTAEIYESKERAAKKAISEALEYLSRGLASLMNILNPGIIVIGGGQSNRPIYRELNRLTKKYTIDGLRRYVKVVKNKLGDSAGIYGAAARAMGK